MTKELLDFMCRLEFYKTNCKNIHWANPVGGLSVHKEMDTVMDDLSEFQDSVVEDASAIYGRIKVGDVRPMGTMVEDPIDFLKVIRADLANMLDVLQDKMYTGIVNSIEDYWGKINISIYRINISLRR